MVMMQLLMELYGTSSSASSFFRNPAPSGFNCFFFHAHLRVYNLKGKK